MYDSKTFFIKSIYSILCRMAFSKDTVLLYKVLQEKNLTDHL